MVRVDTAALRVAAKRLRDEAADTVGQAVTGTNSADRSPVIGFTFGVYGAHDGYQAVSEAWRRELSTLAEALRQLADTLDKAADNYDRSDGAASARFGGGPR